MLHILSYSKSKWQIDRNRYIDGPMDANGTLSESGLLPAAIAMTVADLMAAGLMIVISALLTKGKDTLIRILCHS